MGDLMNTYTCMRGVRFQRKKYTIKKNSLSSYFAASMGQIMNPQKNLH